MGPQSNKVALVGGTFDPLHAGHLAYLRAAQAYGTVVCAVSDAPTKHPPLVPLEERASLIEALGVPCVLRHQSPTVSHLIDKIKPNYYLKGADWRGRLPADEVRACERQQTEVVFTDTVSNSSSRLLADYERRRNQDVLADFETFVLTQPDADPWVPVTPYDRETRRAIEGPHADRVADVFAGCSVLDYGCGFGYLVELLCERGLPAVGWDLQFAPDVDVWSDRRDVVICREVLEHVPVREWANLLWHLFDRATRFVYLTTRFTAQSHLLSIDGRDALDPTHISMANQAFLRALCVLYGGQRRPDLEERLDWMHKGRVLVYEVQRD